MFFDSFSKTFNFTGASQKLLLAPGTYIFECWGAQGNCQGANGEGGKGAYVKGTISLKKSKTFYVFVGEYGRKGVAEYSFNGGGYGQGPGGGASDIRLVNGTWDDFESLKSRIIVAAGGGGPDTQEAGGPGGCLNGIGTAHSNGGTQTSGGSGVGNGTFGKGGVYEKLGGDGCGAGGGGYYGGSTSSNSNDYAGAGGSSFISGYPGCDAISQESTENNITHTNQPNHYSGFVFKSPEMIAGNVQMPSPTSSTYETGHSSNGNVRITIIRSYPECSKINKRTSNFPISFLV